MCYSTPSLTVEIVITVRQAITDSYRYAWIIFNEILKVATISFKVKTGSDTMPDVLCALYGWRASKSTAYSRCSKPNKFRLLPEKNTLHTLLAEVDTILAKRGQSND